MVAQGKETNGATFKATDYVDAIAYIKVKSGQDLTLDQLTNKYDYWKATYREWEVHIKACLGWGKHKATGLPWTDKEGVMKGYFNSHVKRRPFKTKWPIHYEQLTELLAGKMARGDHAGTIEEALNEDSAWNRGNIDLNSSDYHDKDSKGEYEDSEDPNTLCGIVE